MTNLPAFIVREGMRTSSGCLIEIGCICDKMALKSEKWERRQALHAAWGSFLQGCWCINLQTRPDRYVETCQELHRTGLCRLTQFYRPQPATVDDLVRHGTSHLDAPGYFGCWQSHRAVCERAIQVGFSLILEDDVQFNHALINPEAILAIGSYLKRGTTTDVFHLGHIAIFGGYPIQLLDASLTVLRVRSSLMHAYVMTPNGMQTFLQKGVFGADGQVCVDIWLMQNLRQEAIFPQLATQRHSPSSNLNGSSIKGPPPVTGAPHLQFYSHYHMWFDLFFCCIAPISIAILLPLLLLTALVAYRLGRWQVFLWMLLFCVLVLVLSTVGLYVRGRSAHRGWSQMAQVVQQ
jgi:hypothetical protein